MADDSALALVVDDDAINRDILALGLEEQGHRVVAADDGDAALERMEAESVDIVLLDLVMPGMDGADVLARMKDDEKLRHVPVIMVSAVDELDSVVRCIELGAEDYLPKPFDPALLRARVNASLARKRLHDLELDYIEQVGHVAEAAAAVERSAFEPHVLDDIAQRDDPLGQLARVFQRIAREMLDRERELRREVRQLQIEIDETRAAREVAAITDTDYFRDLEQKVDALRGRQ